jgi:hypothetical protein
MTSFKTNLSLYFYFIKRIALFQLKDFTQALESFQFGDNLEGSSTKKLFKDWIEKCNKELPKATESKKLEENVDVIKSAAIKPSIK